MLIDWNRNLRNNIRQRGIPFLNEHCRDWLWRINLAIFDIEDPDSCVIGQLFGNYWEKKSALLPGIYGYDYGFLGDSALSASLGDTTLGWIWDWFQSDQVAKATQIWREEITALRKAEEANHVLERTLSPCEVELIECLDI